jgi:hypothetical protein
MKTNENRKDDLTKINGIGPVRQKWLQETLAVFSYGDMAALSVDLVEESLKANKKIASHSEIEGWIKKAGELAALTKSSPSSLESEPEVSATKDAFQNAESGWRDVGVFIMKYQSRRMDSGEVKKQILVQHVPVSQNGTWRDDLALPVPIEAEHLNEWMKEQIEVPRQPEPTTIVEPVIGAGEENLDVQLEITQVRAVQESGLELTFPLGKPFSGIRKSLKAENQFALWVSLKLHGDDASKVTDKNGIYFTRCYAKNLANGERLNLGDSQPESLVAGELDYISVLKNISLVPGAYRLNVIAELRGRQSVMVFLELPLVQVL